AAVVVAGAAAGGGQGLARRAGPLDPRRIGLQQDFVIGAGRPGQAAGQAVFLGPHDAGAVGRVEDVVLGAVIDPAPDLGAQLAAHDRPSQVELTLAPVAAFSAFLEHLVGRNRAAPAVRHLAGDDV